MDEEEFAADDVWFGNQFRLTESQELEFVEDNQLGDEIAVEDGPVANAFSSNGPHDQDSPTELPTELPTEEEIPTASQDQEDALEELHEDDPNVASLPRAKRNTFSYGKKMILAGCNLFIDPLYVDKFTDPHVTMRGQIKECPRASNGKQYRLEWKQPFPVGVEHLWLRTYLAASSDSKSLLQDAIKAYEESSDFRTPTDKTKRKKGRPKKHPPERREANDSSNLLSRQVPVEVEARSAASASVRTSSTISSLSQSTIASPIVATRSARSTRSTLDIESESDDREDLVETDNIYALSDFGEEDSDDNSEATSTAGSAQGGLAQYLAEINWNFREEASVEDNDAPFSYMGPSGLKLGVAESFTDPFECLSTCGLDYDLVSRLARNSNEYARRYLLPKDRNNRLQGSAFVNISTEEMYHFLGITLRISQSPLDSGGYHAYFTPYNKQVLGLEIPNTNGFARHYMSLLRYKQIRAAFHPEDRPAPDDRDKCYQLRHVINTFNQAAKNAKFMGSDLTFDEGGIGSRHRMNPVRQYNKDKPQKFRVDFFIMACSRTYYIHHMDVYQGKNASNVGINRSVRSLPTTQKAVMNAMLSTGMHHETQGARHISLDNRYQCPELALLLRLKFKILSTGTCQQNRKGWSKDLMNLSKNHGSGTYKFSVDEDNKVICCQWVDSKVVNVVSTILSMEIDRVNRQIGSNKTSFTCPVIVTKYQRNMLGVDKSDQMRAAGGAFATKAHFQKWYKRAYMAILDMMTLNALIVWNLSCKSPSRRTGERPSLKRHEFLWYISQRMLEYKDTTATTTMDSAIATPSIATRTSDETMDGHTPIPSSDPNARCAVCRLDFNIEKLASRKSNITTSTSSLKQSKRDIASKLSICAKCRLAAHPTVPKKPRLIHSIEQFQGKTCFQIAHSNEGYLIFKRCEDSNGRAYNPQMKHPICNQLRELHGIDPTSARKRKRKRESNDDENLSESEDSSS
jgi:Transposase IS4